MAIQLGIIKAVLESDNSPIRFERFCIDLYSKAEGIELLATSRTWDLGRDARSLVVARGKYKAILCATLEKDIDGKVKSDISHLSKTSLTQTVVYCSSRLLSEEKCTQIESVIRQLYSSVESVQVLGQEQLTSLAERHEDILRKHYGAEIASIQLAIESPRIAPEAKEVGLRLALLVHASDDATALKEELARRLIMDTLSNKGPLTPEQLAGGITGLLHLPRTISTNYVRELIKELEEDGLVVSDNKVTLTDLGIEGAKSIPQEAGSKLLEGRIAVRDAIKKLSGHVLPDSQFEKLWNSFQDGVTGLFYSHGLAIVKMIRSALAEEEWTPEKSKLEIPLEEFAERVVGVIEEQQSREEICQAIMDMFFERDITAFEWLTQICGTYVMMCTLGFETLSNEQIVKVLSCFHLIPDSDVVLSLLCVGEDNHQEVERILTGWREIGCKLYMVRPVLEEVAYHAWISEYDYGAFGENLAIISDHEARRLIDNAFVRAFRKEVGDLIGRQYWNEYIKQYKGHTELDYAYIMEHLRDDYGFGLIAENIDANKEFTKNVHRFLVRQMCKYHDCHPGDLDSKVIGKAMRDSRLVSTVLKERTEAHTAGESRTYCLVSSAKLLKEVDNAFRNDLGVPEMVLSISAMGFLLTLTPQVQMGLNTLRSILFDTYLATRLTPAQRLAYRVIASTGGQWDLPWSRRGTLQRELSRTLYGQARLRAQPVKKLRENFQRADNAEFSAQIIASTLEKMAINPKSTEEIRKLKAELEKLHERLKEETKIKKPMKPISKEKPKQFRRRRN